MHCTSEKRIVLTRHAREPVNRLSIYGDLDRDAWERRSAWGPGGQQSGAGSGRWTFRLTVAERFQRKDVHAGRDQQRFHRFRRSAKPKLVRRRLPWLVAALDMGRGAGFCGRKIGPMRGDEDGGQPDADQHERQSHDSHRSTYLTIRLALANCLPSVGYKKMERFFSG